MKLSNFKNEKAIEVLADLMDPLSVMMTDESIKALLKSKPTKLKMAQGLLRAHPGEMIQILAILDDTPVEQYNTNLAKLMVDVLDMMSDPLFDDLFTSQSQKAETSSGSATENTEDGAI